MKCAVGNSFIYFCQTVTSACGGQAHTVVLTIKGKVYTFGCNAYGQLGTATNIKSSTPVKVFGLQENVVMIASHYFHNVGFHFDSVVDVPIHFI